MANDGVPGQRIRVKVTAANAIETPLRLVLDTNVWLDWLVFDDLDVAPVKAAVAAARAEVFVDEAGEAELVRVLAYPFGNKTLTREAQVACLVECRRISRRYDGGGDERGVARPVASPPLTLPSEEGRRDAPGRQERTSLSASGPVNARGDAARPAGIRHDGKPLPVCSDPDDQKFLDLALACGAAFLVTRDRDLLELARNRDPRPPFRIVTPREFHIVLKGRRLTTLHY